MISHLHRFPASTQPEVYRLGTGVLSAIKSNEIPYFSSLFFKIIYFHTFIVFIFFQLFFSFSYRTIPNIAKSLD